jgi:hypothetical protein
MESTYTTGNLTTRVPAAPAIPVASFGGGGDFMAMAKLQFERRRAMEDQLEKERLEERLEERAKAERLEKERLEDRTEAERQRILADQAKQKANGGMGFARTETLGASDPNALGGLRQGGGGMGGGSLLGGGGGMGGTDWRAERMKSMQEGAAAEAMRPADTWWKPGFNPGHMPIQVAPGTPGAYKGAPASTKDMNVYDQQMAIGSRAAMAAAAMGGALNFNSQRTRD